MEEGRGGECAHLEDKWRIQKNLKKRSRGRGGNGGLCSSSEKCPNCLSRRICPCSVVFVRTCQKEERIHAYTRIQFRNGTFVPFEEDNLEERVNPIWDLFPSFVFRILFPSGKEENWARTLFLSAGPNKQLACEGTFLPQNVEKYSYNRGPQIYNIFLSFFLTRKTKPVCQQ